MDSTKLLSLYNSKKNKSFLKSLPQLIVIAVNIVKNPMQGATDEKLDKILTLCKDKGVPYGFSSTRKELGYALYGRKSKLSAKVAALSVINCQGFEKVV